MCFGVGSIWAQESIIYLHGFLFMLAAAYTLKMDGHVRVDIFYREAEPRTKALVNLGGAVFVPDPGLRPDFLDVVGLCGAVLVGLGRVARDLGHSGYFSIKDRHIGVCRSDGPAGRLR